MAYPHFPEFSLGDNSDHASIGMRLEKWLLRLENFFIAFDIKDEARKRAMLFHFGGESVTEIFQTFNNTGDSKDYNTAKTKLTEYFQPKQNTEYAIFKFRQAKQGENEMLYMFATRLRQLAKYCQFVDVDKEIKSQIIQSCSSSRLRRNVLKKPNLTLTEILDLVRALMISDQNATEIEEPKVETVHKVNYRKSNGTSQKRNSRNVTKKRQCWKCGGEFLTMVSARLKDKSAETVAKSDTLQKFVAPKDNHVATIADEIRLTR
ncbi:hypothetical protein HOLleu_17995 [Holothuria leucospilota]|uniref:Retrotransposon gag domain-containing protein n=1 Tax=Holothuria leucospilota TaxID=206669 RepID=A0A9Q1H951_HOLLE|nr:hypothetical protein HOLleu_17995 [Holothuria leucospilota]